MNIANYFIKNRVSSWMFALLLALGGAVSYFNLGQLEDPPFTIKKAMIITSYNGASPSQVEREVTIPLEKQIQQLAWVDDVKSISSAGLSQITVDIKSIYAGDELRQIWDELRRKINDYQPNLPPGVSKPVINDDFGDVFGVLLAVTGKGYSYTDLKDYADYLKRELMLVKGVSKVDIAGLQQQQIFVEISHSKMSNLGISLTRIYQLLDSQNTVSNAGNILVDDELIRIAPTGEIKSLDDLASLIISDQNSPNLIRLSDIATIKQGYAEIPKNVTSFNGQDALHIGVSFNSGVNVVDVGDAIHQRLQELEFAKPIGMELSTIYNQPAEVQNSVKSFITNLLEAVVIVVIVLLIFMGLKSGLLIGSILLFTILGTFIFMMMMDINLQRISLGALIIALGMLVDNAIVVTEGILINIKKGMGRFDAAISVVKQNQLPLLGATIIGIIAFAPIGLSPDASGEFAGSLFWVLFTSLFLSWITAITLTPFLCTLFFKDEVSNDNDEPVDPYQGAIFSFYKSILGWCIHHRGLTILAVTIAMALAIFGFSYVKQAFFPPSTTPMFLVDYWRAQGTDIRATADDIKNIEQWLLKDKRVNFVASTTGQGALRFMLTYSPQKRYSAYGQLIVRTADKEAINGVLHDLNQHLKTNYPVAQYKLKRLEIGPSNDAKIELRISGSDPDVLRKIAQQAMDVFTSVPEATNIRHDWRERRKIVVPEFMDAQARRAGINKTDVDDLLQLNVEGKTLGLYRSSDTLMPIIVRTPDNERLNIDHLNSLSIWSPSYQNWIPLEQIVKGFALKWEDSLIMRLDRHRTLTLMADPDLFGDMTAAELLSKIKPQIEGMTLPVGYHFEWGGEYESSKDAQAPIMAALPLGFLAMFVITVLLFNSVRQPLVIWITVPLAITGVTLGLLALGLPFGFMAMLGFLSLSGMLLKNGIVLLDQINLELSQGKEPYWAVFDSAVSRVRPVCMAAITTILGMVPLLFDDFFASMAVVISFGLGVATILTLIVVPVIYTLVFSIPVRSTGTKHEA